MSFLPKVILGSIPDKLEEIVFDENEIVTYKWVSRRWSLHTNAAKVLLRDFYVQQKALGRPLFCWYAVTYGRSVRLVPESKLEEWTTDGASAHVYAVLRSRVENPSVVYMGDMPSVSKSGNDARFSAILSSTSS
ncbi:unnamed protein product [Ixodes hexagonus]